MPSLGFVPSVQDELVPCGCTTKKNFSSGVESGPSQHGKQWLWSLAGVIDLGVQFTPLLLLPAVGVVLLLGECLLALPLYSELWLSGGGRKGPPGALDPFELFEPLEPNDQEDRRDFDLFSRDLVRPK